VGARVILKRTHGGWVGTVRKRDGAYVYVKFDNINWQRECYDHELEYYKQGECITVTNFKEPAGPWLGTNTGKVISLIKPDPEQITIDDIATGLSNACRFNGQLKYWYSVAEHSIHVAELVPKEYKLQALLHDATEAYICDVPTPLKRTLGEAYASVERVLAGAIGTKFGVDLLNLSVPVLQADRAMLVSERDAFQQVPRSWGPEYENTLRYPNLTRRYTNPQEARAAFVAAFNTYSKN
jgi:5'-deoxynucleotidase YfbR-like HD superfamily hydrolase